MRRWNVLTAEEQPVMFTDADGNNPRAWLLREDLVYEISHNIEGGWEVWARDAARATGIA